MKTGKSFQKPLLILSLVLIALLSLFFTASALEQYAKGDVDGDGTISAEDARLALRIAVKIEDLQPGSKEYYAADFDGDNAVTSADARLILRASVGLEEVTQTDPPEETTVMAAPEATTVMAAPEETTAPTAPETTVYMVGRWEDYPTVLDDFFQQNKDLFDSAGFKDSLKDSFTCRIIVKAESAPDISGYHPVLEIDAPDDYYLYQFLSPDEADAFLKAMEGKDNVIFAEEDQIVSLDEPGFEEGRNSVGASDSHSWGVSYMQADQYAAYLKENNYNKKIVVAVVDTDVDTSHPFLKGKLVSGYDLVGEDSDPSEGTAGSDHGTHVAGIIIDCMPGLNVKIMPVRVMDKNESGSSSIIAAGISCAAEKGAKIINVSLQGPHSSMKDDAINTAISKGATVCVAAGNGKSNTAKYCPAHVSTAGCICVSSIDSSGKPASDTNYGSHVDVAGPGVNIKSCVPGGGYRYKNGTSMATPHISAVAAMYQLRFPSASPEKIEKYVRKYVKDLYVSGRDDYTGVGVPQLSKAISAQTGYTLTVKKGTGIASVSGSGSYAAGTKVTVKATVSDGYKWSKWTSSDTSLLAGSTSQTYTFTMPKGNVTLTASAVSSTQTMPSTKTEIINYYVAAYNRIGSKAKTITRTNRSYTNYKNIVEIGKNNTVNSIVKSLMEKYMVEDTSTVSGTVTDLPPKGVSKLSVSASQIGSASIKDNGSTYTVVLKSTGSDTNYEYNAQPGKGSAGVIGPLVDNNDIYEAAPKFTFNGLNTKYAKASVTATINKSTGRITVLKFDTPCIVYCSSVSYTALGKTITLNNPQVGVEIKQTWKITY